MAEFEMSREEWNKAINDYIVEEQAKIGKPVITSIDIPFSWPQAHKLVTEEVIKDFAWNIGDNNPLFGDPEYAKRTRWGGVIAPPGRFLHYIAETGSLAIGRVIPGVNHLYGGTVYHYYGVVRAGDVYTIHDDYLGVEEKKLAGKPYRLLTMTSKRSYINQDGKTICDALGNTVITCMYPGDAKEKNAVYGEVKKPCYSKEKLEIIHQHFEEDLAGKFRRGAETLYWEDVQEGEELRRLVKGPLDIVDVISFLCATGAQLGGASTKWAVMRNLLRLKDHDTNEWMPIQSFHFDDKVASQMGMPYALAYAAQHEAYIAQLVCNWMGDDGFVKKLAHQQRKACFQGDMAYVKGQVTRKYIEDGEHLVELNVWTENQHGDKVCPSNAIVKLPTRTPR